MDAATLSNDFEPRELEPFANEGLVTARLDGATRASDESAGLNGAGCARSEGTRLDPLDVDAPVIWFGITTAFVPSLDGDVDGFE